ncbi:DUF2637 domain-containing protein [Streptomyces sp. NPDC091259]|uniref:DUF2637 domain-containing protein n=1 Tax=Streptomyces sp. NPDC091259 TaxID=3365976 RepID=UPI00382F0FAD
MRDLFRRLRDEVDPIVLQAVIAAALSFAHLHDVAYAAGQTGWKAWAYPISVDLLMIAAWRRTKTPSGRAGAWLWFAVALTASVGANVVTAGVLDLEHPPTMLRILVAGWPAIAFLGGALLFHSRKREGATQEAFAEPQLPAVEPDTEAVEEVDPAPPGAPQRPVLVTYAEAATRLGMSEVTVRGAANDGRLTKHRGTDPGRVYVDMAECLMTLRHKLPARVGA